MATFTEKCYEENEESNKENGHNTTLHENGHNTLPQENGHNTLLQENGHNTSLQENGQNTSLQENGHNTSLELSDNVDAKENCSGRSSFYKKPIKKGNVKLEVDFVETPQEIRRQRLLNYQKKDRNAAFNASRGILEVILNSENEEEMEEVGICEKMEVAVLEELKESEAMDVEQISSKRFYRYPRYAKKLMMSEWMLEVPQDLVDKWVMVPCPQGIRVIVIACKGSTRMYTKHGFFCCKFNSALPGGSRKTYIRQLSTILDCIWIRDQNTCHVLDVLVWSSQEMVNCEAEFRFFWLKSRIEEISELTEEIENINEIKFSFMTPVSFDEDFYSCLENIPSHLKKIDGLLFYHKEAHYSRGKTPLVVWLKTYMLPEALGMAVPKPYDEKPARYVDFQHHVQLILNNRDRKRLKKKRKNRLNSSEQEKVQEIVEENMES